MTTITAYPTTQSTYQVALTNPTNAYAGPDSVWATGTVASGQNNGAYYGGFNFSSIPSGAVIDSVTIKTVFKASATNGQSTRQQRLSLGTTIISTLTPNFQTATATSTYTISSTADTIPTLAQLQDATFKALIWFSTASGTTVTWSLDVVSITVTYHVLSIALDPVGAADPLGAAVLTTAIPLASTAAASPQGAAALTTAIPLVSTAAASPQGAAALTTAIPLVANGSADASGACNIITFIPLASAGAAAPAGSALLCTAIPLGPAGEADALGSVELTTGFALDPAGEADAQGSSRLWQPAPPQQTLPIEGESRGLRISGESTSFSFPGKDLTFRPKGESRTFTIPGENRSLPR